MAARKLVGSISGRARSIFLRRPQKSSSINPIYRFLLSSNPKPRRPDPHHDSGFRFPSTKTRPFSTKSESESESDHLPHWSMEYRRRLGIHDDDLVLMQHPFAIWRPPRDGEIKINFCSTTCRDRYEYEGDDGEDDDGEDDDEEQREKEEQRETEQPDDEIGAIAAIARNSSGDVVGVTAGRKKCKYGNKIEIQLYAMKAAANLAKELKITGMHDGPVVYESSSEAQVTSCILFDWIGEHKKIRTNMPRDEDLEEVGRSCPIYCGTDDKLKEMLPDYLDVVFDLVDRDKNLAGLTYRPPGRTMS